MMTKTRTMRKRKTVATKKRMTTVQLATARHRTKTKKARKILRSRV